MTVLYVIALALLVLAVASLVAHYHHANELNKLRGEFDSLARWIAEKVRHPDAPKPTEAPKP